jgi:hypothetical protein
VVKRGYSAELGLPLATHEQFTQSLYRCLLHTEPPAASVKAYVARLGQGMTRSAVVTQFYLKQQYADRGTTEAQYVRDLYQAVLGTEPDTKGAPALVNYLEKGGSRDVALTHLLASRQYAQIVQRLSTFGPTPAPPKRPASANLEALRQATDAARERMSRLMTHKPLTTATFDEFQKAQREYFTARDRYVEAMKASRSGP